MILADHIVQSEYLARYLGPAGFNALTNALAGAKKFVFDEAASQAVTDLGFGTSQSLVNAIEFARCPFESTWIEIDVRHLRDDLPGRPNTVFVDRQGYLFDSILSGSAGKVALFWEHNKQYTRSHEIFQKYGLLPTPQACTFDLMFSYSDAEKTDPTWVQGVRNRIKYSSWQIKCVIEKGGSYTEKDRVALETVQHKYFPMNPEYMVGGPAWEEFKTRSDEQVVEVFSTDAQNEPQFILAMLTLLNCRKSIVVTERENQKVNKLRRLKGKIPYFSHKTIQLKLSNEEREVYKKTGSKGTSRAHLVRGHFKVRKTGVFRWVQHVRGDRAKGWIDKDYEVVP